MATQWPACSRSRAGTATTILVSHKAVTCKAHSDDSVVQDLSGTWNTGAPGTNGNGHPLDAAASKWVRCPTCGRLFLKHATYRSTGYATVCDRADFQADVDTVPLVTDTYLDSGNPTTNYATGVDVKVGVPVAVEYVGLLRFPSLKGLGLDIVGHRVIKAEIWIEVTATSGTPTFDVHRILRDDADVAQATWNVYKTGSSWSTAGAKSDGNDRDATKWTNGASVTGTGWMALVGDGSDFRDWLNGDGRVDDLIIGAYYKSGSFYFHSAENLTGYASAPYMRLWLERHKGRAAIQAPVVSVRRLADTPPFSDM